MMGIFIKDLVDHARKGRLVEGSDPEEFEGQLSMDVNDFRNDKSMFVAEQLDAPWEKASRRLEYIEVGFVVRALDDDSLDDNLDDFLAWIGTLRAVELSTTYRIDDLREEKLIQYKADENYCYYLGSWKFYATNKSKL